MSEITAIITTFNEEEHISEALRSVAWCDEVIVVDSFSSDKTVELAKAEGAQVLRHEYESPAKQKNWIIPQAKHERIVLLDADERCTPELQNEIQGLLKSDQLLDAYWIKRKNHFLGQEVKYSGWQDDKVIRFFHRDRCRYTETLVHEEIACDGKIGLLKNKLTHFTYSSMGQYMKKFDRYTSNSAKDRAPNTGRVTLYHLWIKPAFRFFRHYILKLGILDGKVGWTIATLSAKSVADRYKKIALIKSGETI